MLRSSLQKGLTGPFWLGISIRRPPGSPYWLHDGSLIVKVGAQR